MAAPPLAPVHPEGVSDSGLWCLASGVDALYLSGRAFVSPALIELLDDAKERSAELETPTPFRIGEVEFGVLPRAFGRYRYCLSHQHGMIGVTDSDKLPALRVQVRAEFLHAVGPTSALSFFEGMCGDLVEGPVRWGLSRIDLFCDVQGWCLCGDDRHRFVTRARRRDTHEEGEAFTGFEFGRRTTKTVCARIYDKTRQVEEKGIDWWLSVWGDAFDRSKPVLRVEFELGREGLKGFGVSTPREGLDAASRLWASLTEDWMTYRIETDDSTKARWPVAPEWAAIQRVPLRDEAVGLDRIGAGKRQGELRVLLPALIGYLASAGAILELRDLDPLLGAVRELVYRDEDRRGVMFPARVSAREAEGAYR